MTQDRVPPPDPADRESAYELLQRGQGLLKRRHHAQAAVVLERAVKLEPGKASILEALGRAYFNSGQHDRARETFETLLDLDPSSHYAQFALGQSLKKVEKDTDRDLFMTGKQAVEYGLIDEVIASRPGKVKV